MTEFQRMTYYDIKCDICGEVMIPMYGGGWENDRMICASARECVAEIVFPTSTQVENGVASERHFAESVQPDRWMKGRYYISRDDCKNRDAAKEILEIGKKILDLLK